MRDIPSKLKIQKNWYDIQRMSQGRVVEDQTSIRMDRLQVEFLKELGVYLKEQGVTTKHTIPQTITALIDCWFTFDSLQKLYRDAFRSRATSKTELENENEHLREELKRLLRRNTELKKLLEEKN